MRWRCYRSSNPPSIVHHRGAGQPALAAIAYQHGFPDARHPGGLVAHPDRHDHLVSRLSTAKLGSVALDCSWLSTHGEAGRASAEVPLGLFGGVAIGPFSPRTTAWHPSAAKASRFPASTSAIFRQPRLPSHGRPGLGLRLAFGFLVKDRLLGCRCRSEFPGGQWLGPWPLRFLVPLTCCLLRGGLPLPISCGGLAEIPGKAVLGNAAFQVIESSTCPLPLDVAGAISSWASRISGPLRTRH